MRAIRTALMVVVGLMSLLGAGSLALAAGDLTAEQLIALAPVIRSSDAKHKSIEIIAHSKSGKHFIYDYQIIYRAPGRYMCLIRDRADGTPLAISADGRGFIYDATEATVGYLPESCIQYKLAITDGRIKFHWFIGEGQDEIHLDIKSLLSAPAKTTEVVRTGEKTYRLIRTSERGNSIVADIDLSRACPFTRLEFIFAKNPELSYCLEKIAIDEEVGDERFSFPSRAKLANVLPVMDMMRDWDNIELDKLGGFVTIPLFFYLRSAAHNPELRETLFPEDLGKEEWEKIRNTDRVISKALRDLFPSPVGKPKPRPTQWPSLLFRKPGNAPGKTR